MAKKYNGKRRRVTRPRKRTYKRKSSLFSIKKIVKREIARNVENKTSQYYSGLVNLSSNANVGVFANSVLPISPYATFLQVNQSASQGGRTGNQIKIKSLKFGGVLTPKEYNATSNPVPRPLNVIMWLFYKKDNPDTLTVPGTDFLQLGGTSQALTGSLIDQTATVNTDAYRIFAKRVFKLGFANYAGTGTNATQQQFANNDYKYNQFFNIDVTKHLVKTIKYDDNVSTPTTRGLFACFQCVSATGGAFSSAYIPAELTFTLTMSYEDA